MRLAVLALSLCWMPAAVRAAVTVDEDAHLPFAQGELAELLAARGVTEDLVVGGDEHAATLRGARGLRTIPLDGLSGVAAARLVALHAVDLTLAPEPLPTERLVVEGGRRAGLAVQAGLGMGLGAKEPAFGKLAADLTVPVGRLDLSAGAVWWHAPTVHEGTPRQASFDAAGFRLRLGVELGPVRLFAGAFVAPYFLDDLSTGVLFGGTASAEVAIKIAPRTHACAAAALDLFSRRVRAHVSDELFYGSPRAAAALALGLRWELGR